MSRDRRQHWRKILYELQDDYPDNYVPDSFLSGLKENSGLRYYTYAECVKSAALIIQQFYCVVCFVAVYTWLIQCRPDEESDVWIGVMLFAGSCLSYSICHLCKHMQTSDASINEVGRDLKTILLALLLTILSNPLLNTLAQSISTDTIYAMCTVAFLTNMIFHHYGCNTALPSKALSLNSAFIASVCMSSRLDTNWKCLALQSTGFVCFITAQTVRKQLMEMSPALSIPVSLISFMSTLSTCWFYFGELYTYAYLVAVFFVVFWSPAYFVYLQGFKSVKYGPWDEACGFARMSSTKPLKDDVLGT